MKITPRQQAKLNDDVRYVTNKPCLRGHVAERYTSTGQCVICHAEHIKRYRRNNKTGT